MFLILYEPSKKKPFYLVKKKKKLFFSLMKKSRCVTIEPININYGFSFFRKQRNSHGVFFF